MTESKLAVDRGSFAHGGQQNEILVLPPKLENKLD